MTVSACPRKCCAEVCRRGGVSIRVLAAAVSAAIGAGALVWLATHPRRDGGPPQAETPPFTQSQRSQANDSLLAVDAPQVNNEFAIGRTTIPAAVGDDEGDSMDPGESVAGLPPSLPIDLTQDETPLRATDGVRGQRFSASALFLDDAPLVENAASVTQSFGPVLMAMRERRFVDARNQLRQFTIWLDANGRQNLADQIRRAHALWLVAWSHARDESRQLRTSDQLILPPGPAMVVGTSTDEVWVRIAGGAEQSMAISYQKMPLRLAVALLRRRAERTGLALDANIAAISLFDRDASLVEAREAIIAAAQRGYLVDDLISALRVIEKAD